MSSSALSSVSSGIYLIDYFFRAALGSQQNWTEGTEHALICPVPKYAPLAPPTKIPHQSGTFVTTDEPTLTRHPHPKSVIYGGVYTVLGGVHSVGLHTCIMTGICRYSLTQSSYTDLQLISALSCHLSFLPTP